MTNAGDRLDGDRAALLARQRELIIRKAAVTPSGPEFRAVQAEIDSIDRQLHAFDRDLPLILRVNARRRLRHGGLSIVTGVALGVLVVVGWLTMIWLAAAVVCVLVGLVVIGQR